jgi:hypothetical protein
VIPTHQWDVNGRGDVWMLYIDRRLRFSLTYLGLTRAANWADRKQRWKAQDHSQVEGLNDIPEFHDLDEAKAWVDTIVRLA